jgi:triacylglycerol esterase/lipase EstA (alpha/beta hydrolase family)
MSKPRVVLIPGLMGSALKDSRKNEIESRLFAQKHWDDIPLIRDDLEKRGNKLVGKDSDLVWGRFQFLHWIADIAGWLEILARGDGYKMPAGIETKELTEMVVEMGKNEAPFEFRPYASLIKALGRAQADLLVFPFDWRLRACVAATLLNKTILDTWFGGRLPDTALPEDQKVLLIGHSLGGLVARLFVEDQAYQGSRVVRHAIMVGTPNKGTPNAFGYFTGTLKLLDASPVWKALQRIEAIEQSRSRASGSPKATTPSGRPISNIVTPDEQKALVQSLASVIQLFPTYDFVHFAKDPQGKEKQKYADTYKNYKDKYHRKTSKRTLDVLGEVAEKLRDGLSLDAWLSRFNITYDFIGSTERMTNVAMVEGRSTSGYSMKPERKGDGTVPTFSSLDWIRNDKSVRTIRCHEVSAASKQAEHSDLCNHSDVKKLSVARLRQKPQIKLGPPGRIVRGNITQYEAIAREIFLSKRAPFAPLERTRTRVICYALINGVDEKKTLFNPEKVKVGKEMRLKYPPKGIQSPAVVYGGQSGTVKYEYVLLPTLSLANTPAGVLFLPTRGEGFLHLFGIIGKPSWDPCKNEGHAEMQFHDWFKAQMGERAWQKSVASILLWNESLTNEHGFSPCSLCCGDLATLWNPSSVQKRYMHWNSVYVGTERCQRDTTEESLRLMREAGWKLFGPQPPPPKTFTA